VLSDEILDHRKVQPLLANLHRGVDRADRLAGVRRPDAPTSSSATMCRVRAMRWSDVAAKALLLAWAPRAAGSRGLVVMVGLGFGATAAVAWEVGEYATFVSHSSELTTAYTDTLEDLALGSLGALLAALIVGQIAARQRDRAEAVIR